MAHRQVADVGDGMKMWKIASNMPEMQIVRGPIVLESGEKFVISLARKSCV